MSAGPDDAGFLGRWARRKAQARQNEPESEPAPDAQEPLDQAAAAEAPEPFDIEKLPKLDEITAETNMSDFLRKEAPESLRNAALRRAWALDPAIRDYVNPAMEYAWDWNVPGGAPGSGELATGFDVAKAVEQTFGAANAAPQAHPLVEDTAPKATSDAPDVVADSSQSSSDATAEGAQQPLVKNENAADSARSSEPSPAASADRVADPARLRKTARRHGGATPV